MKIIASLMVIGVIEQKIKLFNDELITAFSQVISKLIIPLQLITIIGSISRSELFGSWVFFLCSSLMYALMVGLSFLAVKKMKLDRRQKKMQALINCFGNGGFVGLPLVIAMFPTTSGGAVAAFNFVEAALYWIFGPILASTDKKRKIDLKLVLSPLTISIFIGIAIVLLNINLTGYVFWDTMKDVGSTSKYFASIYIGMNIGRMGLEKIKSNLKVLYAVPLKLIIFPIIGYFIFGKTGILAGDMLSIFIVFFSTPSGMSLPIIAQMCDLDVEYASSGTIVTTVLCLFTMPFVTWLTTVL